MHKWGTELYELFLEIKKLYQKKQIVYRETMIVRSRGTGFCNDVGNIK